MLSKYYSYNLRLVLEIIVDNFDFIVIYIFHVILFDFLLFSICLVSLHMETFQFD